MTGIFRKPKIEVQSPTVAPAAPAPEAPPVPTVDTAAMNQDMADRLRRRRGRRATQLVPDNAFTPDAGKALLGA